MSVHDHCGNKKCVVKFVKITLPYVPDPVIYFRT